MSSYLSLGGSHHQGIPSRKSSASVSLSCCPSSLSTDPQPHFVGSRLATLLPPQGLLSRTSVDGTALRKLTVWSGRQSPWPDSAESSGTECPRPSRRPWAAPHAPSPEFPPHLLLPCTTCFFSSFRSQPQCLLLIPPLSSSLIVYTYLFLGNLFSLT